MKLYGYKDDGLPIELHKAWSEWEMHTITSISRTRNLILPIRHTSLSSMRIEACANDVLLGDFRALRR